MKLLIFTLLLSFNSLAEKKVNLNDRVLAKDYIEKNSLMALNSSCSSLQDIEKYRNNLSLKDKKEFDFYVKKLDSLIAKDFLSHILCNRMEKKQAQIKAGLTFFMLSKFLVLRDFMDSPWTPVAQKKMAKRLLRNISEDDTVGTHNIVGSLYPIIDAQAEIISRIKDPTTFINAIYNSSMLTIDFSRSLDITKQYSLNPYGFIRGHEVKYLIGEEKNEKQNLENKTIYYPVIRQAKHIIETSAGKVSLGHNLNSDLFKVTTLDLLKKSKRKWTFKHFPPLLCSPSKNEKNAQCLFSSSKNYLKKTYLDSNLYLRGPMSGILNGEEGPIHFVSGDQVVRLTQSEYEQSAVIREMINQAKSHILIDFHHLTDPEVVAALKFKKQNNSDIDIKIFLDHNISQENEDEHPKFVFIADLLKSQIKVLGKNILGSSNLVNSMSIDGKSLYFKQKDGFGVQIFDLEEIKKFEKHFLKVFNSKPRTLTFNVDHIKLKMKKGSITTKLSKFLNAVSNLFLRSNKDQ